MMTPTRPRMGCGAWALIAFGVLVVVLVIYDKVTSTDWNAAGADLWTDLQTPLMIAGAIIAGVPFLVTGVWAAVLDSPRTVANGSERRWIATTAGWAAWTLAALLTAFWTAPAGLVFGVGLWAVLVDRRGCAKAQRPVTIGDGWAAVGRLIRRRWIVAAVVALAVTAAWIVIDRGIDHADEVRLWSAVGVIGISITTAFMIRPDVRRTADLRALKPVIARHVLGIPDGRVGDLGWKVRGGPRPKAELGFKTVGAPVLGTGFPPEVWAEVDRRLTAHAPILECRSLTDVGMTLMGVSPDTEARRMLAEATDGLVIEVDGVDQSEPPIIKNPVAIAATNEGENNE